MFWRKLFGATEDDTALALYAAIVARARAPHWYVAGGVLDSIDGRFDMVAAILSLVLLRLEGDPAAAAASARLTERFIADMDGQLRQIGIGDVTVGKHIGKMMGMLGGRLGAYRDGLATGTFDDALVRNLYRGERPATIALDHSGSGLRSFAAALDTISTEALLTGALPA